MEPDRSLCGQPLFLHINDGHFDESVERAAVLALDQPSVGIIALRWKADPDLSNLRTKWLSHQRQALAAWRTQHGITAGDGRLALRSRTATDVESGSDYVWAFVVWTQAKTAMPVPSLAQIQHPEEVPIDAV
jgi:hypothetical protein